MPAELSAPARPDELTRADPPAARPRVLALAAYRFPDGDAMSNRLLHLVRSATPPGGTAVVVNDWPDDGTCPPAAPELPAGVRLITLVPPGGGRLRRWLRRATRPWRVLAALRRAGIRPRDLAGVQLALGLWSLTTWAVLRAMVRRPITVDVLERHDRTQFRHPWRSPYYLRHRWAWLLAGRLADRVTVVSEALERHFVARGRPTLVVPPQVDWIGYARPAPPPLRAGVRLLYAGSAGPKDQLAVVLNGLRGLPPPERTRVHLVIAGMDRERAAELSDLRDVDLRGLDGQVTFLGRVPRDRVLTELGRSHFSVLVRPLAAYAQAGFPSKVPESLAAGCPVLLNHTSDLARYVVDGREGIVLAGATATDVQDGLARALTLTDGDWRTMSAAARERARCFDYRAWTPVVSDFVCGVDRGPGTGSSARLDSSAALSRRSSG